MIDTALQFFKDQTITTTATSNAIDLQQASPDLGMVNSPELHVTVYMTTPFTGGSTPKVTFELQDCNESRGSYNTIASTGPIDVTDGAAFKGVDLQLPIQHRQFLKLKVTTTGSPSTGKCFAAITDGTEKNPYYEREI